MYSQHHISDNISNETGKELLNKLYSKLSRIIEGERNTSFYYLVRKNASNFEMILKLG
jgi:hypothetical protein